MFMKVIFKGFNYEGLVSQMAVNDSAISSQGANDYKTLNKR